jgi:hypothetical protein
LSEGRKPIRTISAARHHVRNLGTRRLGEHAHFFYRFLKIEVAKINLHDEHPLFRLFGGAVLRRFSG